MMLRAAQLTPRQEYSYVTFSDVRRHGTFGYVKTRNIPDTLPRKHPCVLTLIA